MSELARPVAVERVGAGGFEMMVKADAAECASLARRLQLPAVASAACAWSLRPAGGGTFAAGGRLRARVTQVCVVTAEPFEQEIAEDFVVRFVTEARAEDGDELDIDAVDELVFDGVTIDLGEATAEQLALALDPYPRSPGAALPDAGDALPDGAFAALARLRKPG